ncbi:MAG: hypothetical protein AABZ12_05325 [Planctomycetota bacterium]
MVVAGAELFCGRKTRVGDAPCTTPADPARRKGTNRPTYRDSPMRNDRIATRETAAKN